MGRLTFQCRDGTRFALSARNKSYTRGEVWTIRPGAAKATLVRSAAGSSYCVLGWR